MPELYRGLYLDRFDPGLSSKAKVRERALDILAERLRYPLGRSCWTPEKAIAMDFALAWRGGPSRAWRQRAREGGLVVGLVLVVDSETINDEALAQAASAGRASAQGRFDTEGYDFFREREYLFPPQWCPDLGNLRAELHLSDREIAVNNDAVRALITERKATWERQQDEEDLQREVRAWARADFEEERERERIELERRFPGVGPRAGEEWAPAHEAALAQAMEAELDWSYAGSPPEDLDETRPDYWNSDNPETW